MTAHKKSQTRLIRNKQMIFDLKKSSREKVPSPIRHNSNRGNTHRRQEILHENTVGPQTHLTAKTYSTAVYYSNWSMYQRKHLPTDIDFSVVDQVYYAFLTIDETSGKVGFSDTWADIEAGFDSPLVTGTKVHGLVKLFTELKKIHPRLKVSFSIGGWGAHGGFEKVVHNKSFLNTFIQSSVELVETYGFDGLDIDWEYPKTSTEGKLFIHMLELLREALNQIRPGLLLSIASPASDEHVANLYIKEMDRVLDQWNLMCYDYTGAWSEKTGFHSSLFGNNGDSDLCTDSVVTKYIEKGASAQKLILGLPLYGRKFPGSKSPHIGVSFDKSQIVDEGIIDYKELPLGTEFFDHKKVGAFCYDSTTSLFIVYDNEQSVRIKSQYVKSHGLGGGMFWDSAGDDPKRSLIKAFVNQLRE